MTGVITEEGKRYASHNCKFVKKSLLRQKLRSRKSFKGGYVPALTSLKTFMHKENCLLCVSVCLQVSIVPQEQCSVRPRVVFLSLFLFALNHPAVFPLSQNFILSLMVLSVSLSTPPSASAFPHPNKESSITFCSPNSDTVGNLLTVSAALCIFFLPLSVFSLGLCQSVFSHTCWKSIHTPCYRHSFTHFWRGWCIALSELLLVFFQLLNSRFRLHWSVQTPYIISLSEHMDGW